MKINKEEFNKKEYEANLFACYLLIPKEKFDSEIKNGNNTVIGLADYFNVPILSILFYARQLKYRIT